MIWNAKLRTRQGLASKYEKTNCTTHSGKCCELVLTHNLPFFAEPFKQCQMFLGFGDLEIGLHGLGDMIGTDFGKGMERIIFSEKWVFSVKRAEAFSERGAC